MALRAGLMASLLSGCGALVMPAGFAAIGAGLTTAYNVYSTVDEVITVTEKTVCGSWGAYYAFNKLTGHVTPALLIPFENEVSDVCSTDPGPGTLSVDLLKKLSTDVLKLHASAVGVTG